MLNLSGRDQEKLWLSFHGQFTEDTLLAVANDFKEKLIENDVEKKISRSSFYIFVELAQNILRYSAEIDVTDHPAGPQPIRIGTIAAGCDDERIFIHTDNLIQADKVDFLQHHLDRINGLDADGRKKLFKDILRNEVPEGSKGAGVGFVEIARKASSGVEYACYPKS